MCGAFCAIETYAGGAGNNTPVADNVTIAWNEVYNAGPAALTGGECDMCGIDTDIGVTKNVVEYNYVHDCAGPGIESLGTSVTFRYNVLINNSKTIGGTSARLGQIGNGPKNDGNYWWVYNNTVIGNLALPSGQGDVGLGVAWGSLSGGGVFNNLFVLGCSPGTPTRFIAMTGTGNETGGLTYMDNNAYYAVGGCAAAWSGSSASYNTLADWHSATGFDANTMMANPMLTSTTADPTCTWTPSAGAGPQPCADGAKIMAGSPLKGAGINLSMAPYSLDMGMADYYGAAIPNTCGGHNIGADNACP
jgi:hypothetical protein